MTRPHPPHPAVGPHNLRDARALVTGGSSGIGAAMAKVLASKGARLAIAGRNVPELQLVAAATGGAIFSGDLREPGCPQRIVEGTVAALGGLDVLVSNAGIGWAGQFSSMTESEIDALLDVNLRAAALLALAAIPHLQPGAGRIVFIGSVAGLMGVPGESWYSATKAGLGCLADSLRAELRPQGIGVTLVSPGVIDTPFFERRNVPYQRVHPQLMSAQTAAEAIVSAVEQGRDDLVIPHWLSWPARLKVSFPSLYRLLAARFA